MRDVFSDAVTAALVAHPLVSVERGEVKSLTALLTSDDREGYFLDRTG